MNLRGIEFGSVFGASGVTGFFSGAEYPHHKIYKKLFRKKFNFEGMTHVSKTATAFKHKGHTRLANDGYSVKRLFPSSVYFLLALFNILLNAIGLSGPGIKFLLNLGIWQRWTKPFVISLMAVGKTKEERLKEWRNIVSHLKEETFSTSYAVQPNFSCPNQENKQEELMGEVFEVLDILGELNVPIIPKFNLLLRPEKVKEVMQHPQCDAVCMSNTIPYGDLKGLIPDRVLNIIRLTSWLKKYGGGGLSGKYLYPLLTDWLRRAKKTEMPKPIIACGGISRRKHIYELWDRFSLVEGVSIGTVAITRPWRVKKMIDYGNRRFKMHRNIFNDIKWEQAIHNVPQ